MAATITRLVPVGSSIDGIVGQSCDAYCASHLVINESAVVIGGGGRVMSGTRQDTRTCAVSFREICTISH